MLPFLVKYEEARSSAETEDEEKLLGGLRSEDKVRGSGQGSGRAAGQGKCSVIAR